ncbi:Metallo-dependent phosphatase [Mytilinidion resinicola]|uniref:Metallo-dependent phosphatase n=1 Tax=Mytilinidion resinicola TaxID=574789 RepID=A0A6A6YJF8_9PEZI|nr:Metallo-dependent phosphatase [Mytilinidion resinicola]KAF2808688.1 Metallo-dependent phosphatase [Mytilinidion resinicola]
MSSASTVKTRFLIISDTHSSQPFLETPTNGSATHHIPFRQPLPKADVLLHCGDLTTIGTLDEYQRTLDMLRDCDAELKLVIAGNHDISLDEEYYGRRGKWMHRRGEYDENMPALAKAMWTGDRAQRAGVTYLEEGMREFTLASGARLRVYSSPYQPEFCDWAFPYNRHEDRFNSAKHVHPDATLIAQTPVPDFPSVDVLMTHGPPMGILDRTSRNKPVGCEHLLRAARRCKPRLHCFGHIHEAWGAEKITWNPNADLDDGWKKHVIDTEVVPVDEAEMVERKAAFIDASSSSRLIEFGKETLMVNASIMNLRYKPMQAPWLVDLDLERTADGL